MEKLLLLILGLGYLGSISYYLFHLKSLQNDVLIGFIFVLMVSTVFNYFEIIEIKFGREVN